MAALRIAFVHNFGEPREAYFADTPLALLAADAARLGHVAKSVRVYYDGRDRERDREVARRLTAWLAELGADLVVVERVFDPEPIVAHLAAGAGRAALQVTRGDSLEPTPGIEWVLGAATDGTPRMEQLRWAFRAFLDDGTELVLGAPLPETGPALPFEPVTDFDVIALDEPPEVRAKTLLGNIGCPYAADAPNRADFAEARLPIARLGCAFCHMGGDYQKRPDAEVVAELLTQAEWYLARLPALEELVLSDQHALRYLAELVERANARGLRPMRWLFPARPDAFVRERERVARAAEVATRTGHVIELYLSGFEAFSDRELTRYNKGTTKAELVAAVAEMRRLERAHPEGFAFTRARAHSLLLWNPWTSLEDLRESVETMRANDLDELFHEIGRNRLRLYRELPLFWAARRDGALSDAWSDANQGAGRRKGYSSEIPWRFLDPRTEVAYGLARELRDALGGETELAQLAAAIDYAERRLDPSLVRPALGRLEAAVLELLAPERGAGQPARGASERAAGVRFLHEPHDEARRIQRARATHLPLLFAGHEPSAHPEFLALVAGAEGRVAVISDARRFADPSFTRAAKAAGLCAASLRVDPDDAEALAGAQELRRQLSALELRVGLTRPEQDVELARELGILQVRVEVALDVIGLHGLDDAVEALARLAQRAHAAGVAVEVAPLRAGTSDFRWMPAPQPR